MQKHLVKIPLGILIIIMLFMGPPLVNYYPIPVFLEGGNVRAEELGEMPYIKIHPNEDTNLVSGSPLYKRMTFHPIQDSYVDEETPYLNTHSYPIYFFLRVRSLETKNQRSLLHFDTRSDIPYGAHILSAQLETWLNFAPVESRIFDLYRITEEWGDEIVTWSSQPDYDTEVTSWVETGAERKWLEWDVTSDVQGYFNGSLKNYGWLFKDRDEDAPHPGFFCTLRSLESPLIEYFPRLVIEFEDDTQPPSITIDYPQGNEIIYSPIIPIRGWVEDNVGIATIEYHHTYPGGSTSESLTVNPAASRYFFEWNVTPTVGVNMITVNASDIMGNRGSSSLSITYKVDSLPPEIVIQKPENGSLYIGGRQILKGILRTTFILGKITVEVEAWDGESGIDRVGFYLNNELRINDTSAPFEWVLDEPLSGRYSFLVVAHDKAGYMAQDEQECIIFSR